MNSTALITSSEPVSHRKQAHARSLIRLKQSALAKCDALDFDSLVVDLAGGMTQGALAAKHGLDRASLSAWLASQIGERRAQLDAARRASAPACFDRALEEVEAGAVDEEISGAVQLAIARMKHWEKRGSLADRQNYHDRPPQETGPVLQAPPAFTIQILNAPGASSEVRIVQEGAAPAALPNDDQLDLI